MNYKRYLIEFDTGVDLHGRDYTKAAKKAVRGAISHCCLCGIHELMNVTDPDEAMKVSIKLGCPCPEQVDKEEIMAEIPFGKTEVEVVSGGLKGKGLSVPALGDGDSIVMVNAILTVWIDADKIKTDTM